MSIFKNLRAAAIATIARSGACGFFIALSSWTGPETESSFALRDDKAPAPTTSPLSAPRFARRLIAADFRAAAPARRSDRRLSGAASALPSCMTKTPASSASARSRPRAPRRTDAAARGDETAHCSSSTRSSTDIRYSRYILGPAPIARSAICWHLPSPGTRHGGSRRSPPNRGTTIRGIAELIGSCRGDGLWERGHDGNFVCFRRRAAKAADVRTAAARTQHRCTFTRQPRTPLDSEGRRYFLAGQPTRFAGSTSMPTSA